MITAKVTSKGQITIPKKVRDSLKLHTGDRIEFVVQSDTEAHISPVTKSVDDVFGRLCDADQPTHTVEEMNEIIAKRVKRQAQ